jgi:S1-C subfamily serine protease
MRDSQGHPNCTRRPLLGSSSGAGIQHLLPIRVIRRHRPACDNRRMDTSDLSAISDRFAELVDAVSPSVVQVQGRSRPASGVVYAADTVVTTTRALGRENGLQITTHDGRAIDAELAGWDPATSLAVLRAKGLEIIPAAPADRPVRVGNLVLAIARSWTNALTASAGIVAVIGGPLRTGRKTSIEQIIRTSAPMHGGFAGGALVDTHGRVAGITTAGAIRGLTVAIPTSIAWKIAADVLQHGSPRRGFLGIAGQTVRVPERQRGEAERERALLVVSVTAGSPADAAGLLVGDLLTAFDEQPVDSPEDLLALLIGARVGRTVPVRLLRAGRTQELTLTVGERTGS